MRNGPLLAGYYCTDCGEGAHGSLITKAVVTTVDSVATLVGHYLNCENSRN
eukprot:SAG11_NODE_2242_length_3643_cov_7.584368_2_plen_51_part_00